LKQIGEENENPAQFIQHHATLLPNRAGRHCEDDEGQKEERGEAEIALSAYQQVLFAMQQMNSAKEGITHLA